MKKTKQGTLFFFLICSAAVFSCGHLSRYVLLIAQTGGVGVLSTNTVHSVVHLRSRPAVHLERRGYPLKWVSLDPAAKQNKIKTSLV